jgi:hypothetical protein
MYGAPVHIQHFQQGIARYTVMYGVYIRIWPTLQMHREGRVVMKFLLERVCSVTLLTVSGGKHQHAVSAV